MKLNDAQVVRAMTLLGVRPEDFRAIEQAPTFEEGQKRLAELKTRVKTAFRRAAMELHPDRTNNDPAKTEDFRLVCAAAEEVDRLDFQRRVAVAPPVPTQSIHFVFRVGGTAVRFATNQTTTTTTVSGNYWGGFGF